MDGNHGEIHPKAGDFVSSGIPFITAADLRSGRIDLVGCSFITAEQASSLRKGFAVEGDVLLSHKATLGRTATVPALSVPYVVLTPQVTYYRVLDESALNTRYLRFYFDSPRFQNALLAHATGSTRGYVSITRQSPLPITLPPLAEQRRIAAVLGALDDKIELNRKMNRTLEEMAQAVFKSWFIDFDGHDNFVSSELGPIPRGWEIVPVSDAVQFNAKSRLPKGIECTFVQMKDVPTQGLSVAQVARRRFGGGGSKFERGDTLLARITPCLENGKTAFVDFLADGEVGAGSTEFIVMRSKPPLGQHWVYCLARSDSFRRHAIANMTGSSGRQRVPMSCFAQFRVVVPSTGSAAESFEKISRPMFDRIRANTVQSQTLMRLRDTLLPKLISGEVRVPEAAEAVEAAS